MLLLTQCKNSTFANVDGHVRLLSAERTALQPTLPEAASSRIAQEEEDILADNVGFLQTHLNPGNASSEHVGVTQEPPTALPTDNAQTSDSTPLEELQVQLMILEGRHARWQRARLETTQLIEQARRGPHPYGSEVPNQPSLYGWAPGGDREDQELNDILADLRAQLGLRNNEATNTISGQGPRPPSETSQESLPRQSVQRQSLNNFTPGLREPSLGSAAILQTVRSNHAFSLRSRELIHRYISIRDRERVQREHENGTIIGNAAGSIPSGSATPLNRATGYTWEDRATLDSLRRTYLNDPTGKPSEFERIITLLHSQRSDVYVPPSRKRALESEGCNSSGGHLWLDRPMTFSSNKPRPQPTSWLARGMVLSGQQRTAVVGPEGTLLFESSTENSTTSVPYHQRFFNHTRPWLSHQRIFSGLSSRSPCHHDQWSVEVTIHNVDWEAMTLQATMEAINVPLVPTHTGPTSIPQSQSPSSSTFCTYLEGELIDFSRNSLLTESYVATPEVDAHYWRKLEPFNSLDDSTVARALLNPNWVKEQLMDRYQLMRWKETCFIQPIVGMDSNGHASNPSSGPATNMNGFDGRGYNLSINGFYYMSLRRSDGKCEGFYYDSQKSPYQHLELIPRAKCWSAGSWEFK